MTKVMGTEVFFEACQRIIKANGPDGHAKAYAKAGIQMQYSYTLDAIKTQALYILSNLTYWRGPDAKLVKFVLREFAGIKQPKN
jgi:hypothetical protein